MLNFDTKNAMSRVKNAYGKVKNLKKKTKEIICIGAVAFVIGSFVFYDVATGVAYAASAGEAQPHVIKAGGKLNRQWRMLNRLMVSQAWKPQQ